MQLHFSIDEYSLYEIGQALSPYRYECVLGVLILCGALILLRTHHYREKHRESWCIFNKLCDVFEVDESDRTLVQMMWRRMSSWYPHICISSLQFFEDYFMRLIIMVDKSRKLFALKSDLVRIYAHIRAHLALLPTWRHERRTLPRFRNVLPIYVRRRDRAVAKEGLLLNISGGGVHFFTNTPVKKGKRMQVSFDRDFLTTVTTKIVDVIQRNDYFLVRAKYALVYPK